MQKESFSIGELPWTYNDLISSLKEFSILYEDRPILDNQGGQLSAQLFYSWFVAKTMQPEIIIESGVWKGQGTWAFENASPNSKIISLDPYLNNWQGYRSNKVIYIEGDFSQVDWSHITNKENVLCFFDDHQDAAQRTIQCYQNGFKKIMFEDNYPPGQGDCFSLKKLFEDENSEVTVDGQPARDFFIDLISVYHEMPPIFTVEKNRWNLPWETYRSKNPLLKEDNELYLRTYKNEMYQYTWINYLELK